MLSTCWHRPLQRRGTSRHPRAADRHRDLAAGPDAPGRAQDRRRTATQPRPLPERLTVLRGVRVTDAAGLPRQQTGRPLRLLHLLRPRLQAEEVHPPRCARRDRRATRRRLLPRHHHHRGAVRGARGAGRGRVRRTPRGPLPGTGRADREPQAAPERERQAARRALRRGDRPGDPSSVTKIASAPDWPTSTAGLPASTITTRAHASN